MSEKISVGDIVKLTNEGHGYVCGHFKCSTGRPIGLIVKKYLYKETDEIIPEQYVYDVLISGQVIQSLFNSEIMSTK